MKPDPSFSAPERDPQQFVLDKSTAVNGSILIILAVYLSAVIYQGNLINFVKAFWQDFSGQSVTQGPGGSVTVTGNKGPAFWQWAIALLILYALAQNDEVRKVFGPLIIIALCAMFINLAEKNPQMFKTLTSSIDKFFGG